MNGVWTSVDQKNDYIRRSNETKYNLDLILEGIKKVSKNSSLSNIEELCKKKINELEKEYEEKGLDFFEPHGNISRCIRDDLSLSMGDATKELGKIVEALSLTYPGFMISSKIFTNKLFSIISKKYRNLYNKTENYNIKDNLHRIIFEYYRDDRYWIMTPGSYIESWKKQKKELTQLGYSDFIKENEIEILKLIKMQEENSKEFALEEHNKRKQRLSEEELSAEIDKLEEEKAALTAKYSEEEQIKK